jgi:hypothetical protein
MKKQFLKLNSSYVFNFEISKQHLEVCLPVMQDEVWCKKREMWNIFLGMLLLNSFCSWKGAPSFCWFCFYVSFIFDFFASTTRQGVPRAYWLSGRRKRCYFLSYGGRGVKGKWKKRIADTESSGRWPAVATTEISHDRIDTQLPRITFRNSLFRIRLSMKWSQPQRSLSELGWCSHWTITLKNVVLLWVDMWTLRGCHVWDGWAWRIT